MRMNVIKPMCICDEPDCQFSRSECRWRSGSRRPCWGHLEEGRHFCTICMWVEVSHQHHGSAGKLLCPSSPKMEFYTLVEMEALRDKMFRFQQTEKKGTFPNVAIMKVSENCLIWQILLEYYIYMSCQNVLKEDSYPELSEQLWH